MSQDNLVFLACETCRERNYPTTKNPRNKVRLNLSKFCRFCRKHTMHKETK